MRQITRVIREKRKLTKEQSTKYNRMLELYEELEKSFAQYPNDEYIQDIRNNVVKEVNEVKAQKDVYLNTPIERIVTYNISRSKVLKPMKMRISKSLLQNYIFLKNNMI